jgi:hypothetical protein
MKILLNLMKILLIYKIKVKEELNLFQVLKMKHLKINQNHLKKSNLFNKYTLIIIKIQTINKFIHNLHLNKIKFNQINFYKIKLNQINNFLFNKIIYLIHIKIIKITISLIKFHPIKIWTIYNILFNKTLKNKWPISLKLMKVKSQNKENSKIIIKINIFFL